MRLYLDELKTFILMRRTDLLNSERKIQIDFQFRMDQLLEKRFIANPSDYFMEDSFTVEFSHSNLQSKMLESYIHLYGVTHDGLGRISMRAPLNRLYREVKVAGGVADYDYVLQKPSTVSLE